MSPETLEAVTAFRTRVLQAQAEFEIEQVERITQAGVLVGRSGVPDWRAPAWLMNNHPQYRRTYKQDRDHAVEQVGTVTHEHVLVRQLSDSELQKQLEG